MKDIFFWLTLISVVYYMYDWRTGKLFAYKKSFRIVQGLHTYIFSQRRKHGEDSEPQTYTHTHTEYIYVVNRLGFSMSISVRKRSRGCFAVRLLFIEKGKPNHSCTHTISYSMICMYVRLRNTQTYTIIISHWKYGWTLCLMCPYIIVLLIFFFPSYSLETNRKCFVLHAYSEKRWRKLSLNRWQICHVLLYPQCVC